MKKEFPRYYGLFCCACMVIMMRANNQITQEELSKALFEAKRRKSLELKDVQALMHFSNNYPEIVKELFLKAAKDLNEEEKKFGLSLALKMALADNSFEASEKVRLKEMIEMLGFPAEYYDTLITGNA